MTVDIGRPQPLTRSNEPVPSLESLQAASGRRVVALQAAVVVVLLATAQTYDGSIHSLSHWIVLGAYTLCSIALSILETRARDGRMTGEVTGRRADHLALAATILNAAVAIYFEIEHMVAGALDGYDAAASTVSRLPAFLLLLQTALTMRVQHTALYSGLVAGFWGIAVATAWLRASAMPLGPQVRLANEGSALLSFVAASLVVIDGTRRLRSVVETALRLEHERTQLIRFVPDSVAVHLARQGDFGQVRERHACLLAADMRGFSRLTHEQSQEEVVGALLDIRAMIHTAVSENDGIVDKYVGDGVLAQFFVGSPRQQAEAALACGHAILDRLDALNRERAISGQPPLRLSLALHAGDVLAGVFDDGCRAEFTVIGPAMNTLARLEARAKSADVALAASEDMLSLLGRDQVSKPVEDGWLPPLFALDRAAPTSGGRHRENAAGR